MDFLELAKTRYSCRRFTDEPVNKEQLELILEAARSAPTATNAQAYKLWVVKSPEGIEKVNQATPFGFGAKTVIILGADAKKAWKRSFDDRNFAEVDAGIVGAHILLEVQQLGLGSTWVGVVDPAKLAELFPETAGYTIVGLFPVGHPAQDAAGQPSKKHADRRPLAETVSTL